MDRGAVREALRLNPSNGHEEVQLAGTGGAANHFPTPSAADGLLLAASANQVIAYRGPEGLPPGPIGGYSARLSPRGV